VNVEVVEDDVKLAARKGRCGAVHAANLAGRLARFTGIPGPLLTNVKSERRPLFRMNLACREDRAESATEVDASATLRISFQV